LLRPFRAKSLLFDNSQGVALADILCPFGAEDKKRTPDVAL